MWEYVLYIVAVIVMVFIQFKIISTSHAARVKAAEVTDLAARKDTTTHDAIAPAGVSSPAPLAPPVPLAPLAPPTPPTPPAPHAPPMPPVPPGPPVQRATHSTATASRGSCGRRKRQRDIGDRQRRAPQGATLEVPTSMSERVARMNMTRITNPDANGYVRAMEVRTAEIATGVAKSDPHVHFYSNNIQG